MALKPRSGVQKGARKPSSKSTSTSSSASKSKKKSSGPRPPPTQHKPKPSSASGPKRKPPHLRYTEADLKLPALNGIRPAGVQKPPNRKKGKQFTDDASMRTILALVMAEKEGNLESKMMKARQMEEIREARRAEAEKRAEAKKEKFEERKEDLRQSRKKPRKGREGSSAEKQDVAADTEAAVSKKSKKRVSFG